MSAHAGRVGAIRALAFTALLIAGAARADAVDTLRAFVREVQSGRAAFTQTVKSPDGKKTRNSSGRFEFARPDRFRFAYDKPFEQLIVSDGTQVWIHDPDLQQASVRPAAQALGATPAALLAGASLERDFELKALPADQGLQWVQALPRAQDAQFRQLRVGFSGRTLAAIEITDSFGQTSLLRFSDVQTNISLPADAFRFTPPPGVDVIRQ
jgi:outer membrane lipoprotein carrier protein